MKSGTEYSIQTVKEYGAVRQLENGQYVHIWAKWILRIRNKAHTLCKAYEQDELPKLQRYVRFLRRTIKTKRIPWKSYNGTNS